jgi:hypothetical protein
MLNFYLALVEGLRRLLGHGLRGRFPIVVYACRSLWSPPRWSRRGTCEDRRRYVAMPSRRPRERDQCPHAPVISHRPEQAADNAYKFLAIPDFLVFGFSWSITQQR